MWQILTTLGAGSFIALIAFVEDPIQALKDKGNLIGDEFSENGGHNLKLFIPSVVITLLWLVIWVILKRRAPSVAAAVASVQSPDSEAVTKAKNRVLYEQLRADRKKIEDANERLPGKIKDAEVKVALAQQAKTDADRIMEEATSELNASKEDLRMLKDEKTKVDGSLTLILIEMNRLERLI